MYSEDELIPISALQHVLFCERQYALIHIEQLWEENVFTVEGDILHERVDIEHHESRRLWKTEYAMSLRSLEIGLIGKTDLVEFYKNKQGTYEAIIPVEYKRGGNKEEAWDRVQLCAQALCLEEMFSCAVETGQFYYAKEHRRTTISFDSELRALTLSLIQRIRILQAEQKTPPANYKAQKCDRCSLVNLCMPKNLDKAPKNIGQYIKTQLKAVDGEWAL